ncbi:signal peptidase II [Corynebacterium epidermidicanis]|uniref:Lipoprotein signal peptidase n=1 Tax=Corynebacterium epidermidicanis TaxID=1050174 RepID=A0A0G3GVD3_9CORY|nr:signal peptidase II [Corynebacterium epidermidicanis]AKK03503.1 lipoprotein signal peptidase [Corynebacterium epidermidicanis]
MFAIAVAAASIDQLTKFLVLRTLTPGVPHPVIGDWFRWYLLFNSGAAFSFGEGATWVFTCIQLAFVVGIAVYSRKVVGGWNAVGLALIAGGALGNLIDRLFRAPAFFVGHVVDFISVGNFAVFNIADSCITVGVVCFIVGVFLEEKRAMRHA